ncbi:hypothetical protein HPB47_014665 [Ixodes persulcatus]|uniref:Uncharacterized protein n=1 Tax=Ixodes persulcatus TaxID=34615 RepID=A0AC60QXY8_IXOPE|nr:hypothetical protein HPB47_014665 [Ixodes persulcatus]
MSLPADRASRVHGGRPTPKERRATTRHRRIPATCTVSNASSLPRITFAITNDVQLRRCTDPDVKAYRPLLPAGETSRNPFGRECLLFFGALAVPDPRRRPSVSAESPSGIAVRRSPARLKGHLGQQARLMPAEQAVRLAFSRSEPFSSCQPLYK